MKTSLRRFTAYLKIKAGRPSRRDVPCLDMTKLSLAEIWRDHHATLVDARTGTTRTADYLALYLPGFLAAAGLLGGNLIGDSVVTLDGGSVDGMLAAAGLLSAFFFGLSVTVLDKSMDFDLAEPDVSTAVVERAMRMQELAANTAFAAIVAGLTTALLVVAATVGGASNFVACLAVGGLVTILSTGALVLRRVYNETKDRLRDVRTGVSADRRSHKGN